MAVLDNLLFSGLMSRALYNDCLNGLFPFGIGHAVHGSLQNGRMGIEDLLHFNGIDIFAAADVPCGHRRAAIDVVIGRVVGIHINDEAFDTEGKLELLKIKPIVRLGYHDYSGIESIFVMTVPGSVTGGKDGMTGWTSKQRP